LAERGGHRIKFLDFMKSSFLLMLLSIGIAHVYVYWRYL
jgi:Na+/H+ antiporter NhaD/arsenite permease-like protein